MVGYPETLTDPSFRGQLVVSTYPLIGARNTNDILLLFFDHCVLVFRKLRNPFGRKGCLWNSKVFRKRWCSSDRSDRFGVLFRL